ncbi:MAG TPA: nucleotide exchange factor GrpE [Rubrobacteraceae bacterium]|nr:nucleotide exchange factor GrpE [Rubrobacteraceae bacterium]
MSNEERKQEPPETEIQDEERLVEEAEGSPGDPAYAELAEQPAEDPGAVAKEEEQPADAPPPADLPEESGASEVEALTVEIEVTRRERDDYLDALRRLKAEFENSRKRQERERERILQTASENLITELLPVLDNLDRALEHEGDVREGVRATRDQLADVLGREGLLPVASDGQSFDPNVHEAVMSQPSEEHEEGTIIQTFERGYVLNGKPIRPAKVVVASQG